MLMWQKHLDPYISVHITDSSAFLPIVMDLPGWKPMIHIATNLPTAGKEVEYHDDLAKLKINIEELSAKFPSAAVFIRGDCISQE